MTVDYKKVTHIAYSVEDIERTRQWYERVLGCEVLEDHNPHPENKMLVMQMEGVQIEFFEYHGESDYVGPTFDVPFDHWNNREKRQWHFCLLVDDVQKAREQCQELGVEFAGDLGDCFFIYDPDKKMIEFKGKEFYPFAK